MMSAAARVGCSPSRAEPPSRPSDLRFEFGRNWKRYLAQGIDGDRVASAVAGLRSLLGLESLHGYTFMDVGCGSGLHSLAAARLGAEQVISFDVDPDSVECTQALARIDPDSAFRWRVSTGSILDRAFVDALPDADIVYAWGVLHHTGAMWDAVDLAAGKVRPGGWLCLGLYNRVEGRLRGTEAWARRKRWYCQASPVPRRVFEEAYVAIKIAAMLVGGYNPRRILTVYGRGARGRGMSWRRDVTDWLGGYPFEAAAPGDVLDRLRARFGYALERLHVGAYASSVNEYVFHRPRPWPCPGEAAVAP